MILFNEVVIVRLTAWYLGGSVMCPYLKTMGIGYWTECQESAVYKNTTSLQYWVDTYFITIRKSLQKTAINILTICHVVWELDLLD